MRTIVFISLGVTIALGFLTIILELVFRKPGAPHNSGSGVLIRHPGQVVRQPYAVWVRRLALLGNASMVITIILFVIALFVA